MKYRLFAVFSVFFAVLGFVSCFSDDDEVELSRDCIITSISMGTLNRGLPTKTADGRDSTYWVSVTGSLYPLHIDHYRGLIYNTDSLPKGTDVSKVVFSAANASSSITVRSLYSGQDTIFVKTDSLDCRVSRILTVHATDGVSKRSYVLTVNVHQEEGDSSNWKQMGPYSAFQGVTEMKATAAFGKLYVVGKRQNGVRLLVAETATVGEVADPWKVVDVDVPLKSTSFVFFQKKFYSLTEEGVLMMSADAQNWETVPTDFRAERLVACGKQYIIAYANGAFYSSEDACNWVKDGADEPQYLPDGYVSGTCVVNKNNPTFETFVVVGKCKGVNRVWRREVDMTSTEIFPWVHLPETPGSAYNFPDVDNYAFHAYDGGTLMTAVDKQGWLWPLTISYDNGRTWMGNLLTTPVKGQADSWTSAVDDNNHVWLLSAPDGGLWRGRVNRLGWNSEDGVFEKSKRK